MRKEIYESLFNKTAENMTNEDYRLYTDILSYRNQGLLHKSLTITGLIAPWPITAFLFGFAGMGISVCCFVAGAVSLLFGGVAGLLLNPNRLVWYKTIKQFMKREFTKEDLKLIKKEKIYKKILKMTDEFEKTEKFKQYQIERQMIKEEKLSQGYYEGEEIKDICADHISGTYLNKQIEEQRKQRRIQNVQNEEVSTEFEDEEERSNEL